MHRTRIKFCGITRPEDAVAAAAAGADAIGLIFYPKSPRFISTEKAREILKSLPPMVCPVGLFVNSSVDEICNITRSLNIRTVQLHGDETPDILAPLSEFTVIKALRCDPATLTTAARAWQHASALLLETAGTAEHGGTGIENNWAAIESLFKSRGDLPPLIAAGGLTPENVADVVRRLRPYAVDLSSGIEQSKGIKSVDKMNRFASAVRIAESS